MTTSPSGDTAITNKCGTPLFLSLIAAGLAGNFFNFPIFFNVDFLFGGIFAMLALQFFGLGRGVLAAAIIASVTYFLWNHPYAALLRIAEVAVVGVLMKRRQIGLLQADILYWLIIGLPTAYVVYHFAMLLPSDNTLFVITKQAINCIANALAARLIFIGYALWSRSSLMSYREIVYNLLAFFVLCPALILMAVESRGDFSETDHRIRIELAQDSQRVTQRLETWVESRRTAIINLAEMAASRSPQQMQSYLELTQRSDINFLYVGLRDRDATTTATFPLTDHLGQNNLGTNYADRPYLPVLKRTLKPMLSEVVMGRTAPHRPRVLVLAPVVIRGAYGGFVAGALDMAQVQEFLKKGADQHTALFTLIDKNGNVIMTNRTDQTVMRPFVRGKGKLNRLDTGISEWVPAVPPNTPLLECWRKSLYIAESPIGNLTEWKLILEQPMAPFQKTLYDHYAQRLYLLFAILLVTLALAEFLSRKIVATLQRLRTLTYALPVKLVTDGKNIPWPESAIKETNHLVNNFREMANTLSIQFREILSINETLEQRVEERTEELRQSEQRFRSFIENVNDVVFALTPSGVFTYVSPQWKEAFGYELSETVGRPFAPFVHPDEVPACLTFLQNVVDTGENQSGVEYRVRCKDGTYLWYRANASRISDPATGTHTVVGIGRDITELKQAEKDLRESEEKFRALFECAKDGIFLINAHGVIVSLNEAFAAMHGYRTQEMFSMELADLDTPETLRLAPERMGRVLAGEPLSFEVEHYHKDGHSFPLEVSANLISIGDEKHILGFHRDISARKQAEDALRKSKTAAEAANVAKSSFLANVSHEFRTPMNAILGFCHLTLGTDLSAEQLEYLTQIHDSTQSLLAIINDLLDISKIEAGKMSLDRVEFNLEETVGNAAALARVWIGEKDIALTVSIAPEVPVRLKGDPLRLGQVLRNLLNNAAKFTARGSIGLSVEPSGDLAGEAFLLCFTVRDTGIGMTEEQIPLIFRPFVQGDSSTTRKYGGTGLGLSISKQIIDLAGGNIEVESVPWEGTVFRFTMLFERNSAAELTLSHPVAGRSGIANGSATVQAGSMQRLRVLVAEDQAVSQLFMRRLLENQGVEVVIVGDGLEAVNAVTNAAPPFDVILMDIQMPEMDGYEATRRIRELPGMGNVPVIALTAHASREERQRALAEGMTAHLCKPIKVNELFEMLRGILNLPREDKAATPVNVIPFSHLPGIDLEQGLETCDGSIDLLLMTIISFGTDKRRVTLDIRTALREHDWHSAAKLVHGLKGVAGIIAAEKVYESSQCLEEAIELRDADAAGRLLCELDTHLDQVFATVDMLIESA